MNHIDREFERYYNERMEAARSGRARALYDLGLYHSSGLGVSQSYVEAYKYFYLAARRGLKRAAVDCREIAGHLTQSEISHAVELSNKWQ